ncbi:hypothetical protein UX924_000759 [Salmonella enterica]|nr:hypothetical protein [Salmonella enterica subsp. enterica]EDT7138647.1 hypothetical protein [Salmonella enterica subsp. enterica]EEN7209737.1 hypothetical protein [Salmonella enterica subsp. enterica]ELZ4846289.1 hypothetical protein [Salmonella enterica]
MATNKTLEAANIWQIERAKFEEKHPDQRIMLNRIENQLQNNIFAAITMLNDFSFAIREVERKAKSEKD